MIRTIQNGCAPARALRPCCTWPAACAAFSSLPGPIRWRSSGRGGRRSTAPIGRPPWPRRQRQRHDGCQWHGDRHRRRSASRRARGRRETIAVLPGCASVPYPKTESAALQPDPAQRCRGQRAGAGSPLRKWTLIARNRIIAALSELTIVVQGREPVRRAQHCRRSPKSRAPRGGGAGIGAGPPVGGRTGCCTRRRADPRSQDVLDAVCGVGDAKLRDPAVAALSPAARAVLDAIVGCRHRSPSSVGAGAVGSCWRCLPSSNWPGVCAEPPAADTAVIT